MGNFNTDIKSLLSGAAAGAAAKAGYAAFKGDNIKDAAVDGAMIGAAVAFLGPAVDGMVSKVWPAAAKPKSLKVAAVG